MRALLLLGSNGARRVRAVEEAEAFLSRGGFRTEARSSLYASSPFGRGGQPWFLNRVLAGETGLSPRGLLLLAQEAERHGGRSPGPRWGPREIDVDILLYGSVVVEEEGLRIPHPGLAERRFALAPLAEVAPGIKVPPGNETAARLLYGCKDETEVVKI